GRAPRGAASLPRPASRRCPPGCGASGAPPGRGASGGPLGGGASRGPPRGGPLGGCASSGGPLGGCASSGGPLGGCASSGGPLGGCASSGGPLGGRACRRLAAWGAAVRCSTSGRAGEALLQPLDVALEHLAQPVGFAPGVLDEPLNVLLRIPAACAHVLAKRHQGLLRGIERRVEALDGCRLVGGWAPSGGAAAAPG